MKVSGNKNGLRIEAIYSHFNRKVCQQYLAGYVQPDILDTLLGLIAEYAERQRPDSIDQQCVQEFASQYGLAVEFSNNGKQVISIRTTDQERYEQSKQPATSDAGGNS